MALEDSSTKRSEFNRRELWGRLFGRGQLPSDEAMAPPVHGVTCTQPAVRMGIIPMLRPPGAVDEQTFLSQCTKCGDCVAACPHGAIKMAGPRFRHVANTPTLDPSNNPCRACPDRPCVTACNTGALRMAITPRIGRAEIVVHECIAWQGGFCSVCAEQCPVPQALVRKDGKPVIDPDKCWGCGVCQHVCPAPILAVRITPIRSPERL